MIRKRDLIEGIILEGERGRAPLTREWQHLRQLGPNLALCFSSPTLECIELSRYSWNVWPVLFLKCFYFHKPRRDF